MLDDHLDIIMVILIGEHQAGVGGGPIGPDGTIGGQVIIVLPMPLIGVVDQMIISHVLIVNIIVVHICIIDISKIEIPKIEN